MRVHGRTSPHQLTPHARLSSTVLPAMYSYLRDLRLVKNGVCDLSRGNRNRNRNRNWDRDRYSVHGTGSPFMELGISYCTVLYTRLGLRVRTPTGAYVLYCIGIRLRGRVCAHLLAPPS